jgi:hypothetical protein
VRPENCIVFWFGYLCDALCMHSFPHVAKLVAKIVVSSMSDCVELTGILVYSRAYLLDILHRTNEDVCHTARGLLFIEPCNIDS